MSTFESTEKALINLDLAPQFVERSIGSAARLAQASQNEPRRFLRNADLFRELHAADSLAGCHKQIHRVQPFIQRHLGALKNRIGPHSEIKFTCSTAIETRLAGPADSEGRNAVPRLAVRANRAIRPKPLFEIDSRAVLSWEQREELESANGGAGHSSAPSVRGVPVQGTPDSSSLAHSGSVPYAGGRVPLDLRERQEYRVPILERPSMFARMCPKKATPGYFSDKGNSSSGPPTSTLPGVENRAARRVYNVDLLGSVAINNFACGDHCIVAGRKRLSVKINKSIIGIDPSGVVASVSDVRREFGFRRLF